MDLKYLLLSFEGRIGRQSFWIAYAVLLVASLVASLLAAIVSDVLPSLISLVFLYPGLALAAKRWHDRDKPGWWSLLLLVPIVGPLWMLVELGFLPGTPGPNRYGPNPLNPTAVPYRGRTYYRHPDGRFTDHAGSPVRDAVLIGGLGAAYVATQTDWIDTPDEPSRGDSGWADSGGSDGGGGGD